MDFLATIIAALVVLLIVLLSVRSIVRRKKRGGCGCGCEHCSGCGMASGGRENHA